MRNTESRLSAIETISANFGIKALAGQISACKSLLSENAAVNVAVLGKFKAGKSSFLNSLAGREVLPTGAIPVTAVVTGLYWAPSESAAVKLLGGESSPITFGEIAGYVTEELNPKNRRGAALVEIGLPTLAAYKGARFIDTPGLDSAFRHNTETSLDWLPNTGLALITVSADAPLSEQDLELIEKTRRHSPHIIVILTKADRLTSEELPQVLAFVRGKLKDRFGKEIPVYPFSIKEEYEALREEFRAKALNPFTVDIGAERAKIIEHKLGSLERQCKDYLLAAKAAAQKSVEERKILEALALEQKARFETLGRDFKAISARNAEQYRLQIEKLILAYKPALEKELKAEIQGKLSGRAMNLLEMTRNYAAVMEEFFAGKTAVLFEAEKSRLEKMTHDSAGSFAAMVNDFIARLSQEAEKALGSRLPQSRWEPGPERLPAPDVRIGQAFDSHIELLWFLIPARLLRNRLLKHFAGLVPFEVEKNLTRLAMGLSTSLNGKAEKAMAAALTHAKNTLDTVERLLCASPDTLNEIEAAVAGLRPGEKL